MLSSVRTLLSGIIDYAGMFPPAQLPLEQAIRNYARYRTEPENWMLGRFICPAAALEELSQYVDLLFGSGPPLKISALGKGGNTLRDFLGGLAADLNALLAFRERHGERAVVDQFEVRLPLELLAADNDGKDLRTVIYGPDALLGRAGIEPLAAFYEVPAEPDWFIRLGILIGALIEDADRRKGFKFRCGGTTAAAIPAARDVAFAIEGCAKVRAPLKFTAGLHHPLRRRDEQLGTETYGFLNIFVAGVLGNVHRLNMEQLVPILEDREASHFVFTEDAIGWGEWKATTEQIEALRRHAVTSFGSCSFDEPREDLKALGMLP